MGGMAFDDCHYNLILSIAMKPKGKIKLPITHDAMVIVIITLAIYIGFIVYLFTPIGDWLSSKDGNSGALLHFAYVIALFILSVVVGIQTDKVFTYKEPKRWKPVFRKKLRINEGTVRLVVVIFAMPFLIPIIYFLDHYEEYSDTNKTLLNILLFLLPIIFMFIIHWSNYVKQWFDARYNLIGYFPKPQGQDRGIIVNKEGIWLKKEQTQFLWHDVKMVIAESAQMHNTEENDRIVIYIHMADGRLFSTVSGFADYEDVFEGVSAAFELYEAEDGIGYIFYADAPCATMLWRKK